MPSGIAVGDPGQATVVMIHDNGELSIIILLCILYIRSTYIAIANNK